MGPRVSGAVSAVLYGGVFSGCAVLGSSEAEPCTGSLAELCDTFGGICPEADELADALGRPILESEVPPDEGNCVRRECLEGTAVACDGWLEGTTWYFGASGDMVGAEQYAGTARFCGGAFHQSWGSVGTCAWVGDYVEVSHYDGPTLIDFATSSCEGAQHRLQVYTTGWVREGIALLAVLDPAAPWDEEHDLASVDFSPSGHWDELERTLEAGSQFTPEVSSRFTCEDAQAELGYLARVYDPDGILSDCGFWGPDGAAVAARVLSEGAAFGVHGVQDAASLQAAICVRAGR